MSMSKIVINRSQRDTIRFNGFDLFPGESRYITESEYAFNRTLIAGGIKYNWLSMVEFPDKEISTNDIKEETKSVRTRKSKKGNN